ncbi:MAG: hypothetical protein COX37_00855 [Candidatus Nealsonbacteria bacterium CG23_combo_of_CG06-09_8_20_14_all_39_17]|uniref:PDZ domain-containing protein n=1 Tax=Candidatus Nealsonbacteria bacterium CG23_combo_of_CG06-09_8_20_14_all_39_17 TaxID=1974722 RepID=A0A2G9YUZ9_9BACT|nr:MAG: hypothetical protein COX37_00855 [Candidatus Nealsonbacteria bacterium CG23_combo_of_CG06-09_8_20_14_all_39_17]
MKKLSFVKMAEKACPAVITIVISRDLPKVESFYFFPLGDKNLAVPQIGNSGEKETLKIGGGSGFIISPDGYIATCQHVVEDAGADYTIILEPKKRYPAKIISRDSVNDVAILKIEGKNFPFLKMGSAEKLKLGQGVMAVGNALGEFHDTVSTGVVSGLSRYLTASSGVGQQTENLRGLIQTDAAINPGNSGGPLMNDEGEVIGVNTASVMGAQNLGFAVPIDCVKRDLAEIKKYGKIKRPFLGIKYITLDKEISEKNKLPVDYGALIVRESFGERAIVKGSSAEKIGLKEYDIILTCQGEKIDEKNPLTNVVQKFDIGESVKLEILREGKIIFTEIKLEERK